MRKEFLYRSAHIRKSGLEASTIITKINPSPKVREYRRSSEYRKNRSKAELGEILQKNCLTQIDYNPPLESSTHNDHKRTCCTTIHSKRILKMNAIQNQAQKIAVHTYSLPHRLVKYKRLPVSDYTSRLTLDQKILQTVNENVRKAMYNTRGFKGHKLSTAETKNAQSYFTRSNRSPSSPQQSLQVTLPILN
jgi:hypothetical protein